MGTVGFGAFGAFFVVWLVFVLAGLSSFVLALIALISVVSTPEPAFGPWWDNTRSAWIIGAAVSFVIPFGGLVVGILWLGGGRRGIRQRGIAGRPFWAGPMKPYPPAPWGGYGPQA